VASLGWRLANRCPPGCQRVPGACSSARGLRGVRHGALGPGVFELRRCAGYGGGGDRQKGGDPGRSGHVLLDHGGSADAYVPGWLFRRTAGRVLPGRRAGRTGGAGGVVSVLDLHPRGCLADAPHQGTPVLNLIRGIGTLFESSLAVVLAVFTGLGYWALVYAMLASSIGMSIAVFFVAGWRPSFVFDGESFRYMFRFGISGLGFSIANYLKQNVDYLIVARLLGSGGLGLYEFAYRLPHLVLDRISRPIGSVFFPFFSKIQDNESLLLTYVNSVSIVTLITWPLVFGLAGIARVAVPLLWGDQWLATIEPLQVLCLGAGLRCLAQPSGAIFLSRNKPELQLWLGIGELAFTLIAVGTLGGLFGLIGVAAGMSLSAFPPLVSTHIALHLLGKNISFLFRSVGPTAISAVICGSMAYCVSQALPSVPWVKLGVSIAVGAALYVGMLALVSRQLLLLFFGTLKRLVGTPR